jgi:hypothetical protein
MTLLERLFSKISSVDDCWIWGGGIDGSGYGVINIDGSYFKVHRISYEIFIGPIPSNLVVDHTCRIRNCINPGHLEPVTQKENVARALIDVPDRVQNKVGRYCQKGRHLLRQGRIGEYLKFKKDGVTPRVEHRCKDCDRDRKREYRSKRNYLTEAY